MLSRYYPVQSSILYALVIGALAFGLVHLGLQLMSAYLPVSMTYLTDATTWTANMLAIPLPPSAYIYAFNVIITITAATILVFESNLMATLVYPIAIAANLGLVYWIY